MTAVNTNPHSPVNPRMHQDDCVQPRDVQRREYHEEDSRNSKE